MRFWGFCREVLGRLAPGKQKYFRGKNTSFMNNKLNKEIMKRLRLRHEFFTSGNDADRKRNRKATKYLSITTKKNTKELV